MWTWSATKRALRGVLFAPSLLQAAYTDATGTFQCARDSAYAKSMVLIIDEVKRAHVTSLREIARCLNARGFKTPNAKTFAAQSVKNIIDRTTRKPADMDQRLGTAAQVKIP